MATITFMERGSSEWDRAWTALAGARINAGLADPSDAYDAGSNEVWQYMGTSNGAHEFRHRCHPATGERVNLRIVAA